MLRPARRPQAAAVRHALLDWFKRHARSLPWRQSRLPYTIWVSEIMLQQTQVATVIPYYHRFLRVFPTLQSLAKAPLERVLEMWSGLGYYRRARNLHAAVQVVTREFGGRFPNDYLKARSLPGVGDYTARAILSIAYQQPFAVVDGNVARVVSRLKAIQGNINQPNFRAAVQQKLDEMLSRRRPGDFNQAIMELGQTVCLPRAPRCPICPCRKWCEGFRRKTPEAFPAPRPRRAREDHYLASALIRRAGKVALVRGLDDGLLSDLWNFPSALGRTRVEALQGLRERCAGIVRGAIMIGAPVAEVLHTITHRSIRVEVYPAEVQGGVIKNSVRWISIQQLNRSAVSQLARKISAGLEDAVAARS